MSAAGRRPLPLSNASLCRLIPKARTTAGEVALAQNNHAHARVDPAPCHHSLHRRQFGRKLWVKSLRGSWPAASLSARSQDALNCSHLMPSARSATACVMSPGEALPSVVGRGRRGGPTFVNMFQNGVVQCLGQCGHVRDATSSPLREGFCGHCQGDCRPQLLRQGRKAGGADGT